MDAVVADADGAMNDLDAARRVLATIPDLPGGEPKIERLRGGVMNASYRVDYGSETFVLRLSSATGRADARHPQIEWQAQELAAAAGLAPAIVHADPAAGVLLSEYLPGRAWSAADLDDDVRLAVLADLLRRVHALPPCGTEYAGTAAARTYFETLRAAGRDDAFARRCLEIVETTPPETRLACCHNDVVAENVIGDAEPKLIDWEYAGDNDPMFDLASLIGWHDLDEWQVDVLLGAYTAEAGVEARERLDRQWRRFDAIQWLWLAERMPEDPRLDTIRRRLEKW